MNDQNVVILIGHVVREAQHRITLKEIKMSWFIIVVNEDCYKDEVSIEKHNYFKVLLFDRMAETYTDELKRGKFISVKGRLRQNEWEKDGEKRREIVVIGEHLQYLEKKNNCRSETDEYNQY
jgi:single-strand DNA-binding protein